MTRIFKPNHNSYKVLTPTGFQPFAGVSLMGYEPIYRITFEQGVFVECTSGHKFYINETECKQVADLSIGDTVFSSNGYLALLSKEELHRTEPVYDLIEVENGHRYYTNTLLSSNCEFLVDDETLIDSIKLSEMLGNDPKFNMGTVRWYKKPTAGNLYLAALDPSLGTGGDYGAIQVFELPSFTQVAEWQHNLTPIQGQVKIYREILRYIQEELGDNHPNSIYWSVENNTVGDSALVVIENLGEETFPGLFLSEPLRKGHVKKFRKGFNTTFGNKISSCARLKYLIEEDKMSINSRALISELKSFVASGVSFKAKQGQHDDLVSSALLVVRMSTVLAEWDYNVFETLSIDGINEDWEAPLPVFVSSYF